MKITKKTFSGIFAIALILNIHMVIGRPVTAIADHTKAVLKTKLSIDDMTKNVEFAFCKAKVPQDDLLQLNQLAQFLTDNNYAISLRGHADAIGSYLGNWKMSEARANAIKNYLVTRGVSEERIVTTAFGSTIPIANNKTSAGRKKNRRVEIRLKPIGA